MYTNSVIQVPSEAAASAYLNDLNNPNKSAVCICALEQTAFWQTKSNGANEGDPPVITPHTMPLAAYMGGYGR